MNPKMQRVLVTLADSGRKWSQLLDNVSMANQRKMLLRRNSSATSVESLSARDFKVFEFDAVGYEYELHIRSEITQLMDQIFRLKMHSSLMHFSLFKIHNINFLTRVLVAEVDKAMLALRCRIKSIKLEYYDVRKFDLVNMLERQRWARRRQTNQSNSLTMLSTREVLKWLLSDYKLLRNRSMGDEYINVQFAYVDGSLKEQRVQLKIFQICNCSNRTDLLKFFSLLPIGKKTNITMMTDCIKNSFDLKEPTPTLLMFELPISENQLKLMSKMLQLAHTAYVNIDTLNNKTNQMTQENQMFHDIKEHALSLGFDSEEPRSVSSLLSTRVNKTNLSYWYRCINDAFANVTASMTEFYSTSSQHKLLKMCRVLRSFEDYEAEHNESSEASAFSGKVQELAARRKYLYHLANFLELYDEVKKTASTLEAYISAKNYELIKAEKLIKQQAINYLRQGIMNFIKLEPLDGD